MKNKVEKQMFDEFDFMYHHKKILNEKEEQRKKAEEEAKAALEAEKKASEAALLKENNKENKPKKADKKEKSQSKKIHPKYGKPYKNDKPEHRKKPSFEKRKKIEREYKEERKKAKKKVEITFAPEISAKVKAGVTRILSYALIAAGVAVVIFGISFGAARFMLGYTKKTTHKNILYQVGLSSNATRVSYTTLIRDGTVYVGGNDLVTLCGFTVTGTEDEIKYISPDSGNDTVTFYKNSSLATVNKNKIRLEAETYEEKGKLYIPMSFFTSYATGIVCEYIPETEKDRAQIKVYKNILNEYDHKVSGAAAVYEPVTFRVKEAVTLDRIDESFLIEDIKEEIYKIDITPYNDAINPKNI